VRGVTVGAAGQGGRDQDRASSGVMILEYVAHAAVADIRWYAAPAALGSAVLSHGVEDHAGFAASRPAPPATPRPPTGPCWLAS
jgi:hypothetical protein